VDASEILRIAARLATELGLEPNGSLAAPLHRILSFCCAYPELFPSKRRINPLSTGEAVTPKAKVENEAVEKYLTKYITDYYSARRGVPVWKEPEGQSDPAVIEAIKSFFPERVSGKSEKLLAEMAQLHRTSMVAENIVGQLLEYYIAPILEARGWTWCSGETVRAVDFFRGGESPIILQVKNAWNSENSSSSGFRRNLNVEKWFRRKADGTTKWAELPDNPLGTPEELNEQGFQAFIGSVGARQVENIASDLKAEGVDTKRVMLTLLEEKDRK